MYTASAAFNTAIHQPGRIFRSRLTVSGMAAPLDDAVIQSMGFKRGCVPDTGFMLGGTISQMVTIRLIDPDGNFAPEDFTGKTLQPELAVQLADESFEYIPMGLFIADQPVRKEAILEIVAFDAMVKLERPYSSALTYPTTVSAMASEIASQSGLTLATATWLNNGLEVPAAVTGTTMRQMIGFIAEVACGFARISRAGALEIVAFSDNPAVEAITPANYFPPMTKADEDWTCDGLIIKATPESDGLTYGTSPVRPWGIVGNPLLDTYPATEIMALLTALSELSLRPYSVSWQGNPCLDPGDVLTIEDHKTGVVHTSIAGSESLTYTGGLRSSLGLAAPSAQEQATSTTMDIGRKVMFKADAAEITEIIAQRLRAGEKIIVGKEDAQRAEIYINHGTPKIEMYDDKGELVLIDATGLTTIGREIMASLRVVSDLSDGSVDVRNDLSLYPTSIQFQTAFPKGWPGEVGYAGLSLDALLDQGLARLVMTFDPNNVANPPLTLSFDAYPSGGVEIEARDSAGYVPLTLCASDVRVRRDSEASDSVWHAGIPNTSRINTWATLESVNHPLQLGLSSGRNLRLDVGGIMSIDNGAQSALHLNRKGGIVVINQDAGGGTVWHGGNLSKSEFAPASHNHAASAINSGTLNIARIPVGSGSTQVAAGDHGHWYVLRSTPGVAVGIASDGSALRNYDVETAFSQSFPISIGSGSFRFTGCYLTVAPNVGSDAKLKKDIEDIVKAVDLILNLRPRQFKMLDGQSGRIHYGLIAQEVEEAMAVAGIDDAGVITKALIPSPEDATFTESGDPIIVDDMPGGPPADTPEDRIIRGLRYEELIAPLIATVQAQQAQIVALEQRLTALESTK